MGEPAFKPSPTKPIPKWMQWLPSQRDHRGKPETRPYSILDEHFHPPPLESTRNPESVPHTVCPTSPAQDVPQPGMPLQLISHLDVPHGPESGHLDESTIKALKGHSFVSDEPLKRPSSRVTTSTLSSPSAATLETVAPPSYPEVLPSRSRSPYAPRQPSPLATHDEEPNGKDVPRKARLHRPSSPLTGQVAAHLQRYIRRTPPAQSREFLNTYRPTQANPSLAMPGRERDQAGGGARQIRHMLGRKRTPSPLGRQAAVEQAVTDGGDIVDLRSMRKRSSMQSELKKLFGGRGQGRE